MAEITVDSDPQQTHEWLEAFDQILAQEGSAQARHVLGKLIERARRDGLTLPGCVQTPYVNTISVEDEPTYPGDEAIERRIRAILRWNSAVMVHRANQRTVGLGGHISTYASAATLFEVGFNHFFRGREAGGAGDQLFFQGHASPGIYARALLEGRLTVENLEHFRREVSGKGLSSYPHPWLMPDFWEFPSVSMGLSPLTAIYQARFNRYLRDRRLKDTDGSRVWCFLGDGECDEPETLGSLSLAAREGLDNLIFVVNCNLQRLDGPVRGNGKIIQELEAVFRGAGWNVLKVLWGRDWDPLLAADKEGILVRHKGEAIDGDYQRYSADGDYARKHFFGRDPRLLKLVEHLSDEQIRRLRRGGHDVRKVYAAYHHAVTRPNGRPTAILAKTVKGWGLGDAGEGRNIAHQTKNLRKEQLAKFRDRLGLPIPDDQLDTPSFFIPPEESEEIRYLRERRRQLGGSVPRRIVAVPKEEIPPLETFSDLLKGRASPPEATTQAYGRMLATLLKDPKLGPRIVPIIPDEARTFGLDALFRRHGIYSSAGQLYEPVDKDVFLYYREAKDGQVLEEGITEAGAMAGFTSAGTSYATHGLTTIPFYIYYSMFGHQRVGDLVWAAADARAKGFLLGATAGRTTLNGEGLQHQDGHSHLLFSTVPNVRCYDPAWSYEVAVILHDGLCRLYRDGETALYYVTLYNEQYPQPPMPPGVEEGILRGLYRFKPSPLKGRRVQLLGSGPILREALRAQEILANRYQIAADVWSATSYQALRRDALEVERLNALHPGAEPCVPYVSSLLGDTQGPVIAVSDNMKAVPEMIARWLPGRFRVLGTDGFGRSDSRPNLRRHFEVDAERIAYEALYALAQEGGFPKEDLVPAMKDLGIDPDRPDPVTA